MSRYWHHPESACVFMTGDEIDDRGIDGLCEEIDHHEFVDLKSHYAQADDIECSYCANSGYFYSDPDLGYCNCEHATKKIHEDNADLLGTDDEL